MLFSNIRVVVDGALLLDTDEPFLLNGRVYVPLRTVAEALDKEVAWQDNLVLIGSGKQGLLLPYLAPPSVHGVNWRVGESQVNGTVYEQGFHVVGMKGWKEADMTFNVGQKYIKEISGSIALDDGNKENVQPVKVKIMLDKEIIWQGTLKSGQKPIPITIKPAVKSRQIIVQMDNLAETRIDFIGFKAKY
ncbi:hypothetical protein SPSYN_00802 [Sporotomaculum syntrophicum]|uniref:Copper amine oxidase-like N-terminal domain-containing protein n=1 Tax=Sporotomaculum syntrophicum TaxID=182264 RepID=A0A9D2WRE9_9FIRM|nr:hypothetical protein SPSYN_00802 [Sporotomaculum syntrophicum]